MKGCDIFNYISDGVECPGDYIYNPHSQTCYRIVPIRRNWDDAQAYCENDEDRLAVFDSLKSISWAKQMRKTNPSKSMQSIFSS